MTEILQTSIPYNPLKPRKMPGIQPLDPVDWLAPDEAFAGQMAERERLLAEHPDAVLALDAGAMPAAQELLRVVLDHLYDGARGQVVRPDGAEVAVDWEDPMASLGRLTQQDFCILQKPEGGDEHVLTGAALCFPAGWRLQEKYMRPLVGIHIPVDSYDANIAARVQRLFDGVQPGRPLWRFNSLWYLEPDLFQPRKRLIADRERHDDVAPYLRSEKQMIVRLPETGAAVFCIHTRLLRREDVMAQWGGA